MKISTPTTCKLAVNTTICTGLILSFMSVCILLLINLFYDFKQPTVSIQNPNCEAWFESQGNGASLECADAGVAIVIHGKNCNYALQNHKQLVLRCDNIELKGEIK